MKANSQIDAIRFSRRATLGLVAGALATQIIGCAQAGGAGGGSNDPIVIGLITEVTGPQAGTGDNQTNGIKLAIEEINAKGGIKGRRIKLVIEDDTSTPNGAVNAFNKVVDQKPVAIIAPNFANFVMAIEPQIRKAALPTITGASGPGVTAVGNPYIFRVRTNDAIMGKLAADYALKDIGAKKVGILHVTGEMGAGAGKVVKESLEAAGAAPVGVESYNADDKDVTAQLLNLQKAGADLIIGWSYPPDAAMVMTSMSQLGVKMKLLGSPAYGMPDCLKLAKEAGDGHNVIMDWLPSEDATVAAFVKKIEAQAKLPANFIHSVYYDGANLLFKVIEEKGADPKAIVEGLRALKGYQGITGEYAFDAKGDGLRQAYAAQIKGGKAVLVKPVK